MVAVVVYWDIPLQGGRIIVEKWSLNGRTLSHYTGGSSAQSLLIHVMVLKYMSLCAT